MNYIFNVSSFADPVLDPVFHYVGHALLCLIIIFSFKIFL